MHVTATAGQPLKARQASKPKQARKPQHARPKNGAKPPAPQREPAGDLRKNASAYAETSSSSSQPSFWQQEQAAAAATASSSTAASWPAVPLRHKPEVLAPVGGWPQLHAAVENGADAIYFGLSDFNARARASNFDPEELPAVMQYLHDRGVKGYVVLNVLVFDEELALVEQRARQMAAAGVDAVIVQDIGAVELLRRAAPSLPIHGSTQMSITSREGARFAATLGVSRVVVGRELSIQEITRMAAPLAGTAGTAAPAEGSATAEGAAAPAGLEAAVGEAGAAAPEMPEVEAFVQGALCVSYSGQCFSSEAWGGRSANRGQCAQACRMPYGFIMNGQLHDLQDMQYLLSPQDLAAVELVPELVRAGVSCFKIEGRLKGPEYVAATTALYRRAVDAAWEALAPAAAAAAAGAASTSSSARPTSSEAGPVVVEAGRVQLSDDEWRDLRQVFARGQDGAHLGLTPGFLLGPRHQELVRGRAPRHRGNYAGRVLQVTRAGVVVELACGIHRGDGLVFDRGDPQAAEEGGQVYDILLPRPSGRPGGSGSASLASATEAPAGGSALLVFGQGQIDLRRVRPGDLAWRNKDPSLEARLRGSYEGLPAAAQRRLPVAVAVRGALGEPLRVALTDPEGRRGEGATAVAAVAAEGRGVGEPEIRKAVGVHLGGEAPLVAAEWDFSGCQFGAGLFVPAAAMKEARRQAVAALMAARREGAAAVRESVEAAADGRALDALLEELRQREREQRQEQVQASASGGPEAAAAAAPPQLRLLCRTRAQVEAALRVPWLQEVVLDFLEVHGLKEACAAVRSAGRRLVVATPRVLKPGEERLLQFYLRLGADALLLRSAGALQQLQDLGGPGAAVPGLPGATVPALEGDFSLNAANALSADLLLRAGLARLAPTHDCNAAQVQAMARTLGPARAAQLELILHQHLPIFHTEHCVFARFLSEGNSFLDCGHPCERNSVHLRDSAGADHLVLADQGCRNTVFNAQAQSGLPLLPGLLASGLGAFRIELVDEPAEHIVPLLEAYRQALAAAGGMVAPQQRRRGSAVDLQAAQRAQREWEAAERRAWALVQALPDANGRVHGAGLGSLEVRGEKAVRTLKPTAAAKKAR